jgi:hypothetical protein
MDRTPRSGGVFISLALSAICKRDRSPSPPSQHSLLQPFRVLCGDGPRNGGRDHCQWSHRLALIPCLLLHRLSDRHIFPRHQTTRGHRLCLESILLPTRVPLLAQKCALLCLPLSRLSVCLSLSLCLSLCLFSLLTSLSLSQAIDNYDKKFNAQLPPDALSSGSEPSGPQKGEKEEVSAPTLPQPSPTARPRTLSVESVFKSNFFLRFAKSNPKEYLRVLGLFLVITEMISVLTPSVAIGIQWMAALCPGTAKQAIFGLIEIGIKCLINGDCANAEHCLLLPH